MKNIISSSYSNIKVNPNFYGKISVETLPDNCDNINNSSGYILAPYILSNEVYESSDAYEIFMSAYRKEHKCCPVCNDERCSTTLAGYIFDSSKPENYKDMNRCVCVKCGNEHTCHDRVKKINNETTK